MAEEVMVTRHMLTTIDNPWDPWDSFDEWYAWDARAGYHSPSLLARVAPTSHELSDADNDLAMEQGIEEIVRENVSGVHTRVPRKVVPESGIQDPVLDHISASSEA